MLSYSHKQNLANGIIGTNTVISRVSFYKRLERGPERKFLQKLGQNWILSFTQLQWLIKKNHIWWTQQKWSIIINKQQTGMEFNYLAKSKLHCELYWLHEHPSYMWGSFLDPPASPGVKIVLVFQGQFLFICFLIPLGWK